MKKIIATVLAMVMALALCSTAFAADTVSVKALKKTDNTEKIYYVTDDATITLTYHKAEAAQLNSSGKQTNVAHVAYYTTDVAGLAGVNFVAVGSVAEADWVVYYNCKLTNNEPDPSGVALYLAEANPFYSGSGTVFTNFGDKCGQVSADIDKDETYYTTNAKGDKNIYVTADDGDTALMVGGKLVSVTTTGLTTDNTVKHTVVPTIKDGKTVGYTCSECKAVAVKAANYASIPAGAEQIGNTNWYFPAAAASTTTTTTSSPKTFDAGIAMYVGMALTSVAGSAVVIGKKKEF